MSRTVKPLDFLGIGAGKSGTTTLFHYLKHHPQLYLPPEKEIPFFSDDSWFCQGWQTYAEEYFLHAPADKLWGKISPQYMSAAWIPERIAHTMPAVKLIVLLRSPIDRALSYYRMMVRHGKESRTFEEAVREQLQPANLANARHLSTTDDELTQTYLVRGEYGRILGDFRQWFPREQICVAFTDDLEQEPQAVLNRIYSFLGVKPEFTPPNLGKRYHVGGTRQRFPQLISRTQKVAPIRWLWRTIPSRQRRVLFSWYKMQFNIIPDSPATLCSAVREQLIEFYRPDLQLLERLLNQKVPWAEFAKAEVVVDTPVSILST
ncbi:MAG: sulfotransferase [Caldilineaceae bacterium]